MNLDVLFIAKLNLYTSIEVHSEDFILITLLVHLKTKAYGESSLVY